MQAKRMLQARALVLWKPQLSINMPSQGVFRSVSTAGADACIPSLPVGQRRRERPYGARKRGCKIPQGRSAPPTQANGKLLGSMPALRRAREGMAALLYSRHVAYAAAVHCQDECHPAY